MRWSLIAVIAVFVVAIGTATAPHYANSGAPAFAAANLARAKCHYVTKKVKGKSKRVKVCTKPKPTPTPAPSHLIDASGYVWVDGAGNIFVSSGYLPAGANGWVSKLSPSGTRLATFRSSTTLDGAGASQWMAAGTSMCQTSAATEW